MAKHIKNWTVEGLKEPNIGAEGWNVETNSHFWSQVSLRLFWFHWSPAISQDPTIGWIIPLCLLAMKDCHKFQKWHIEVETPSLCLERDIDSGRSPPHPIESCAASDTLQAASVRAHTSESPPQRAAAHRPPFDPPWRRWRVSKFQGGFDIGLGFRLHISLVGMFVWKIWIWPTKRLMPRCYWIKKNTN